MVKINNLEIYTSKINNDIRLLICSDFHLTKEEKNADCLKKLYKIINCNKIDYNNLDCIVIPGDLVNNIIELKDKNFKEKFIKVMNEYTKGIPTFISYGNHEMLTKDKNGNWNLTYKEILRETLSSLSNIKIIENGERVDFGNLSFSAFSPEIEYYLGKQENTDYYLEKYKLYCQNNFDKSRYNIFLTHDPQSIIRLSKEKNTCIHQNTDLVISGHMHNGLLPNVLKKGFKNKGLISPKMKLFPNFAQGEYKIDYTYFIIAGPVNTRVENAIINNLYGANATILTLKKTK